MRTLSARVIAEAVAGLCVDSCHRLGEDVLQALRLARESEESPVGREVLDQILENAAISAQGRYPLCQDTGVAVFFVELGAGLCITDGDLEGALNEGVRRGYAEGYLRKSVVADPLDRRNTGDNTPAVIHVDVVPGQSLRIQFMPKGGGAENMSALAMLRPSDGTEGVIYFVVETVRKAGANPCPPVIVGVGIGSTFDGVALEAKKALLRRVGSANPETRHADLERQLLQRINDLGIGPMGLGGRTTALAVHVSARPCHIASLPVAVNIQCHSARRGEIVL